MEYINNTVTLKGEREYLNNLKSFLEQYIEKIESENDNIICVNLRKDVQTEYDEKVIEAIRSYPSSSFWFDYAWCKIGSPFFGDILEYDTLYFRIDENSAWSIIADISQLFPQIEFNLSWEPQSILYYAKFGTAKIRAGKILEMDDTVPQAYLDELDSIFNDEEEPGSDHTPSVPVPYINEEGELVYLPF